MGTRTAALNARNRIMVDSHYIIDANHTVSSSALSRVPRSLPQNGSIPFGLRNGFDMDSNYIVDGLHPHIIAAASYRVGRNRPQNAAIPFAYHTASVRRNRPQNALRHRHTNGPRLSHVPMENQEMSYEELLALGERVGNVSMGLSVEAITAQLMTKLFIGASEDQENDCCVICQDEYKAQQEIGVLRCGHMYHASCVRQWLQMKNVCPLCKSEALATTQ